MSRSIHPSPQARLLALCLVPLLALLLSLSLLPAAGAQPATPDDADATLEAARRQVDEMRRRLDGQPTDAQVTEARRRLLEIQQRSEQLAIEQAPALASAKARLTELGPVPDGGKEAPDVAEQRRGLQKTADAADARSRLARLLALESGELADRAGNQWRARFRAQLFERTDSVLTTAFWHELRDGWPRDAARLERLGSQFGAMFARTPATAWIGLLAAVAALVLLRAAVLRRLGTLVETRIPSGRVRRSLYAVVRVAISTAFAAGLAYAVVFALGWGGDPSVPTLVGNFVLVVGYAGFVVGLGRVLLSVRRPSWRLLPVRDDIARGLRHEPLLIAAIAFSGWLLRHISETAQLNLATEVTISGLHALALGIVLLHAVTRSGRLYRASGGRQAPVVGDGAPGDGTSAAATGTPDKPDTAGDAAAAVQRPRPWWLALGLFVAWAALIASMLGILLGYVALGGFVVRQVLWIGVLGVTAYLLVTFIDDAFDAWLGTAPPLPDAAAAGAADAAARPVGLRSQAMVLSSAALRLCVLLVAVVLVLVPFGETPSTVARGLELLSQGLSVGELQLKPGSVLQAVMVFVLAMVCVRVLTHWLVTRFLPTTSLDAGMRSSIATLLGFVGSVLAIGLGLSAVGLALDKVAWIASALTVGIGFGLQAVVSNFVSGLILLAERPVKVGDWVALGGVEGDIRRINVRATEIQMGDRSTLIVPNSEFITKVVRNVTHDSPLGLVQIKLPMPLDTDPAKAREILLGAFAAHAEVLDVPAPNVQIDGIDAGNVVFNATGFVASPRRSYGVRSALLFEVLQAMPAAGLPLSKRPTMVLRETPPAA